MIRPLLLSLVAFAALSAPAEAAELFVSPGGSGSTCSQAAPCSIGTVFDATSGPPARPPAMGDTVRLSPGEYNLDGRYLQSSADYVTIQGPIEEGSAATPVPRLLFGNPGPAPFADTTGFRILGDGTVINNISISGSRPGDLVEGRALETEVERVRIENSSPLPGVALRGSVMASNSVLIYSGSNPSGRAVEITGSLTGSLAFSRTGIAISIVGKEGSSSGFFCKLSIANTIAWGGAASLRADNRSRCTNLVVYWRNNWIPSGGSAALGGGIISSGTSFSDGSGNLPNNPAVINPLESGWSYLNNLELPANSPAVDAGGGCCDIDFYGRPRPIGAKNDIGPYEASLRPYADQVRVMGTVLTGTRTAAASFGVGVATHYAETTYKFAVRNLDISPPGPWQYTSGGALPASDSFSLAKDDLSGLEPSTEYEVRVEAKNSVGEFVGMTTEFSTPRAPKPELEVLKTRKEVTRRSVRLVSRVRLEEGGVLSQKVKKGKMRCSPTKEISGAGTHQITCNLGRAIRQKIQKKKVSLVLRTTFANKYRESADADRITLAKRR